MIYKYICPLICHMLVSTRKELSFVRSIFNAYDIDVNAPKSMVNTVPT